MTPVLRSADRSTHSWSLVYLRMRPARLSHISVSDSSVLPIARNEAQPGGRQGHGLEERSRAARASGRRGQNVLMREVVKRRNDGAAAAARGAARRMAGRAAARRDEQTIEAIAKSCEKERRGEERGRRVVTGFGGGIGDGRI